VDGIRTSEDQFERELDLTGRSADCNAVDDAKISGINLRPRRGKLRAMGVLGETKFIAEAIEQHSRIFERVKARDAEGARRAMEDHLALGRDNLRRTTGDNATG
jgi:DNA-binding GntR family transcriptional regulator